MLLEVVEEEGEEEEEVVVVEELLCWRSFPFQDDINGASVFEVGGARSANLIVVGGPSLDETAADDDDVDEAERLVAEAAAAAAGLADCLSSGKTRETADLTTVLLVAAGETCDSEDADDVVVDVAVDVALALDELDEIFPCTALACLRMAMMSPRTKMPRSRR